MKPKTKSFLSNFFGGLISNDRAIEGAKTNPWWVALIIGIVGVLLPVIPITVSQAKTYGASFLAANKYNFDQNIASLTVEMLNDKKEFVVGDDHLLTYQVDSVVTSGGLEPVATKVNSSDGQYELMIYYLDGGRSDISSFIQSVDAKNYKVGTTNIAVEEDVKYAPSYVILFKDGIYTRLNKNNSTEAGNGTYTNFTTDWKEYESGHKLLASTLGDIQLTEADPDHKASDRDVIYNNWVDIYNKAFMSQKRYNTWVTSAIFLAIYVALLFIMGLLLWLLTRGKNNMFSYLKFMDTQKMAWWTSLTPSILAMIVGFIFSNFAQMAFIVLLGLRTMWIAMKQLRPQY